MVGAHPPNQRAAKKRNQYDFNAGGNVGTDEDRGRSSPLHTSSPTVYITKTLMKMRNTAQMSYQTSKTKESVFSMKGCQMTTPLAHCQNTTTLPFFRAGYQ